MTLNRHEFKQAIAMLLHDRFEYYNVVTEIYIFFQIFIHNAHPITMDCSTLHVILATERFGIVCSTR